MNEEIRSSCAAVMEATSLAKFNEEAAMAWLSGLDKDEFSKTSNKSTRPPLNFSLKEGINYVIIESLLNFGSGWRHDLHEKAGRGAYSTIQRGMVASFISSGKLDAEWMKAMTPGDVGDNFGFPTTKEEPVNAITTKVSAGPLHALAEMISDTLKESGQIITKAGATDFDSWLESKFPVSGGPPSAVAVATALAESFPAFNDRAEYDGKPVLFMKKAQLAASELARYFAKEHPERCALTGLNELTVFVDNVLPAMLRGLGIVEFDQALLEKIDGRVEVSGSEETVLRAAGIHSCARLAELSRKLGDQCPVGPLDEVTLDYWLWVSGKKPEFRKIERHAVRKTVFY